MRTRRLIPLLLLLLAASRCALAEQIEVERVGFTVGDMARELKFLTQVLDFEVVSDSEVASPELEKLTGVFGARCRVVRLRLGEEELELTQYLASPGKPYPPDSRSNDRWFQHVAIVTSDIEQAYRRLRAFDVQHASTAPQRLPDWNPNAAGIKAFYFRDPDGHVLEILEFPRDKGDPKWQTRKGLFLGIDHTAIVVADTEASLKFYRDRLGFKLVGRSENSGDEQAHLNNVEGARVRISTLRAPEGGIGIELLEYVNPTDGRPYPPDAKPNDLLHWQVTLSTDAPSPTLVRDPDRHALLIQPAGK